MSKALATKKVAAVLLGLGMVLAIAGAANAQTTTTTTTNSSTLSALQAQVQALLAQIAALQGTGTATTGSGACFTFTQDEWQGQSGGQVMWVQEFLNGHGFTVAASGAGSPGNETSYFGALTKAAVMNFQSSEGITPVSGYWGPLSRAKANAICAGSTTTTTTTTTTGTGPGITVSAGVQPANSLAPTGANRVPFTTFTLTNNSGAAVTINGVDVQRTGLASNSVFAGVVLLDPNGVQIGTSRTFNSDNQAEVGTPFTLNSGQSETFTIAGNMQGWSNDTSLLANYAGQVASISVVGVDTTVPVSGTLPITGAQQTINASLVIGTANVTLSSYDPDSARNEPIGTTGVIFSGVRIQAGSAENEKLYSITWNQTGSIGSGDLSNLVTIVNGTSYPMTVDSTGKYYTATFPGGITVNEGNSIDAYVQGDITGSDASGRTVEFDVYRPSDIYLVGQTFGYGITPTAATSNNAYSTNDNTSSGFQATANPFYFGSTVSVTAGTLSTISSAGSVGSQNIAINVSNQPLGGFETDFTGEPVTVQSLTFHVASSTEGVELQNVSLVDSNGNVVAGPVNETDSTATIYFGNSLTFPVGAMTYTLEGTVASTNDSGAQTSTLGAITYQVSFNPGGTTGSNGDWTGAQGETSGSSVSLSETTITMSTMTVQGGSLVITAASTPAATTVAPGANNFVVANINLDASQSGEDIRINSLPIVIDSTSTTDAGAVTVLKQDLSNCQLWNGSTVLNSQSIGSGQWNPETLTGTGNPLTGPEGLEANFVFQSSLTVPKGTVVTLSLECNISSSLYNGAEFAAGVDHAYLPSPVGAQSGNSITPTITYNSVSGVMTVGSASLAVSNPTPISYAQVAGGTTGVTVGTFTLQPTSDSVNLQNIALALNSNYASSSDAASFQIWDGSTQIGTVNFQTVSPTVGYDEGGNFYVATTSVSSVNIPQNTQTVLTIKANVNQIGTGQAAKSGHEFRVSLANAQGVGASSGTTVNSGVSATSTTGVAIFRSYPTIALSSYLPSNGVADGRLIAFSVTANANNPVGINQFAFGISTSSITTLSGLSLYAYTDSGFSQPAGGTVNGIAGTTNYNGEVQQATTTMATPLEIPAGTTEYFLLKGTVSPANSTSYNIATTLKGDSTDLAPNMYTVAGLNTADVNMIWSPNSTTTSVTTANDWTSGYGVSGLPSIGLTENRTN